MIPLTVWEVVRSVAALICYTVLPGLIITHFIKPERNWSGLGSVSWWIGWSIVANAALISGIQVARGSLSHYAAAVIVFNAIGSVVILARVLRSEFGEFRPHLKDLVFPSLTLLIALIWFAVILQNAPRLDYEWDQWFHIAHIRQAAESNSIVPGNPYWSDVPLADAYGQWHSLLAAVARSARMDVLALWRIGNAYMAALGFLVMYSVAGTLLSGKGAQLVAAIVFIGSGFGALQITRTFIYPWGITVLLLWISLSMFYQYLLQGNWKAGLSALTVGLVPILIHPQEYIMLCFAAFALAVSALLVRQITGRSLVDIRRVWLFFGLITMLGLPILMLAYPSRMSINLEDVSGAAGSFGAELRLYEHPLAKVLARAFPYFWKARLLLYSIIPFNVISLFLVFLLSKHLDTRVRWFLTTLAWAPTLAAVFPGLSWVSQMVLRETYSWRLLILTPTPFIWSSIIVNGLTSPEGNRALGQEARMEPPKRLGWGYRGLAVILSGAILASLILISKRDELGPTQTTPLHHQGVFDRLDELASEPGVVLSDPETSYTVPGLTKHYVVLNEPSHGSRDDLTMRFAATRALLSSPYQSSYDAVATLRRYQIDFIVINKPWLERVFSQGTSLYSDYTLSFLNANPACFQRAYDDAFFAVFEVADCSAGGLVGKGLEDRSQVSPNGIEQVIQKEFTPELTLIGYSLEKTNGRNLAVGLYWQVSQEVVEPYAVWLELLCDYPNRHLAYGKALRRASEMLTGRSFGIDTAAWMPLPPDRLGQQHLIRQDLALQMPANLGEGPCDLQVHVLDKQQALRDQKALPYWLMEKELTMPGIRLCSVDVSN